jgi:hypothetical protein
VVSAADIGFIIFVLAPGNIAFFPGVLGPVFWILAAVFSSHCYLSNCCFVGQIQETQTTG